MSMRHQRAMHRAACLVGGYAAMYTILMRLNFGSSQTVNMLEIFKALLGRSFAEAFLHFLGTVIYGASVFAAAYLKRKGRADVYTLSGSLSMVCFTVMGFLPADIPAVVGLYPTFIMMSFMWVVFGGLGGYASSPIFSTNNFRQTVGELAEYCADGDKKHLDKARFFGGTLLTFHVGAVLGYAGCMAVGLKAAFFGLIPCLILLTAVNAPKLASALGLKKSPAHN